MDHWFSVMAVQKMSKRTGQKIESPAYVPTSVISWSCSRHVTVFVPIVIEIVHPEAVVESR